MADEAFALSPIAARAALPSEADYDAIREAFMETSRGRWFLAEYARRNRNADTRMVLDAVARIEENLTAQTPAREQHAAEILAALSAAVDEAVLDMIALEMAAPDLDEAAITEPPVMPEASIYEETAAPVDQDAAPEPQPSLGAALIANGIVQKGDPGAADPLAPLRRMSQ